MPEYRCFDSGQPAKLDYGKRLVEADRGRRIGGNPKSMRYRSLRPDRHRPDRQPVSSGWADRDRNKEWQARLSGVDLADKDAQRLRIIEAYGGLKAEIEAASTLAELTEIEGRMRRSRDWALGWSTLSHAGFPFAIWQEQG